MKKTFKVIGICMASIIGLIGVAVAIIAIQRGGFGANKTKITSLQFEESTMLVVDDFTANISFVPANANDLTVKLKVEKGENVIEEIPSEVKAGTPFTIKVKKDASGNNVGGEIKIKAIYDNMIPASNELNVLVDVAIPTNGLLMWADTSDEIIAQTQPFDLFVFTNPNLAINPNTGEIPDLLKEYKNITITSSNPGSLEILNNGKGVADYGVIPGYDNVRRKYIKYRVSPKVKSEGEVYLYSKAFRTYFMQDDYVNQADYTDNLEYYAALSAYIEKYKTYYVNDTRPYNNENGTMIFENGNAFINSTLNNGVVDIKPNDNTENKINAANYYMYVDVTNVYNIISVSIKEIQLKNTTPQEMNLHTDVWEFDKKELKDFFGINIVATSDEYDENTLDARINEIKIMPIRNNVDDTDGFLNYDLATDVFEITNPTNLATPVWTIRAKNPILNSRDGTRLRFYLTEKDETNVDEEGNPTVKIISADIAVNVRNNEVTDFKLNALPVSALCLNEKGGLNGEVKTTILNKDSYVIQGVNPTYTTVKFFVTRDSATYTSANGSFFKLKLNKDGSKPTTLNMPVMKLATETPETIQAYEINNNNGINTILEALNVTGSAPVEIFAAIVKTDYNGNPIYGEDAKTYTIVKKSNTQTLDVVNYLEKLNIYTSLEKIGPDDNSSIEFYKRNVGSFVMPDRANYPEYAGTDDATNAKWAEFVQEETRKHETVKLLANENYKFYLTNLELKQDGSFNKDSAEYKNKDIDYLTNLNSALKNVRDSKNLKFGVDSTDGEDYVALNTSAGEATDEIINGISFVVVDLSTIKATKNNLPSFYADFANASAIQTIKEYSQTKLSIAFSDVTEGNILTSVSDITQDNIEITAVASTGKVSWISNTKDFHLGKEPDSTDINNYFEMLLDIGAFNADDEIYTSNKIDFSYNTKTNVERYMDNIKNKNNMKFSWSVRAQDKDYVVVGDANGIPTLAIKKGLKTGAEVKLTCVVSYYPIDGKADEFHKSFSKTVTLKIIQDDINFVSYSNVTANIGGADIDALIENKTKPLEIYGGDSFNLLQKLATSKKIVRQVSNGFEDTGKTSQRFMRVTLGETNDIIKDCTFKIIDSNGEFLAYFKDDAGNKVYSIKPNLDDNLVIYAEDTKEDRVVRIEITSDLFSSGVTKFTYDVLVKSSINISVPLDANNKPVNQSVGIGFGNDNTGNGVIDANDISLDLALNKDSVNRYQVTQRVITSKNLITNQTNYVYKTLPINFEFLNALNYVTMSSKPNYFVVGGNSGEIKSNQIYYENLEGNLNPKTLNFVINPVQVPRVYETTLNMYYYLPKIKNVEMKPTGTEGEVTYKYNYETYIDGGVDTHRYIFKQVLVGKIVVKTVNHVNATLSPNLNDDNPILVKSGTEDLNLFNKYGKEATVGGTIGGTTNFIDIKYNGGSQNGEHITYYNLATETNYYNNFIKLEFDYSKLNEDNGIISGVDNLTRLANLFGGTHISDEIVQQNLIKIANGEVVTSSVNFDFILRVKVLFLIKDTVDSPITKGTSVLFDFKIKFTKSVEFNIGDADYNTSNIPDTDIVVGGHEYTNNEESLNTITLTNKTIKLYDSTVPVNNNIVKIVGGGAGENLTKNNITEINVYKFNKLTNTYEMVVDALNLNANNLNQKLFISWLKNEDGTTSSINLVIIRSVNEEEQYKVELKSATFNISGDYYFKVLPTFIAKANYPVEKLLEKAKQGGSVDLKTNYINPLNRVTILKTEGKQIVNYSLTTKTESEQIVNYLVENILDASGNVTHGREIALKNASGNVNNITLWNYAVVEGQAFATVNDKTGVVNFLVNDTNDIKNVTVRCYIFNGAYIDYKFQVYKTITQYALTVKDGEEDITPSNPLVVYANRELNLLNYITLRDSSSNIVNEQLQIKYVINETTPVAHYKEENKFTNQITKNTIINNSNAVVKFEDVASVYGNNINTLLKFDIYTTNSTQNDSQLKTLYIKLLPNIELKQNITILPAGDINKVNLLSANSSNIAGTSNDIFQLSENSDRQGQLAVNFKSVTYAGTETIPSANILANIKLTKDATVINAKDGGDIVIDFTKSTYNLEFSSGNIDKDIIVTFEFNKTFSVNGAEQIYATSYTVTLKPNINVNFNYSSGKNYKEIESASISEGGRSFTVVSDQSVQLKDYNGLELKDHIIVTYHLKDAKGNLLVGHDNPSNDKMMSPIYAFGKDNGIISFNQVNKETTFQVIIKITWYNKSVSESDKIAQATYDTVYFIHFMPNITIPKGTGGIADKSLMVQYKNGESSIAGGALPVYAGTTVTLDFGKIEEFAKQSGKHIAVNANQNANGVNKPANLVLFKTIENVNNATGPYEISEGENANVGLITFGGVLNGENDIVSVPLYLDLKGNYAGVIEPDKSADTGNYISPSLMDLYNELGLVLKFKIINSVASIEYADGKNDATVINMKSIIENGTSISGGLARNQFKLITTEYFKFIPIKNNNVPLVTFVKSEETDNVPYVDIDNLINLFTIEFKILNSTGDEDDGSQYVDYNSKTGVITFKPYTNEVKIIARVSLSTNSSVVIQYNFDVPNKGYVLYSSATDGIIYGQSTDTAIQLDADSNGIDLSKQILYFYMKDAPVETPSEIGDVNSDVYDEVTGILTITRIMGEKKIVYTGYKLETNTFKYTIDVPDNNSKLVGTSLIPTMFYAEDITNTHNVSLKIEVLPGYAAIPMHVEIKPKLIVYNVIVDINLTPSIDGLNKAGYLITPNLTVDGNPLAGVTYAYNIDASLANYLYVNKETNKAYVVDRSKVITLFEEFSFKVTATINQANTFVKQVLYNMEPTVLFRTKNISVTAGITSDTDVDVTMVTMEAYANNETIFNNSAVLLNKLPKDEYQIEIRAVDFALNDYFILDVIGEETTSVIISTDTNGILTNNIWKLKPRNVVKDENKVLKVRLYNLKDANVYFEKDVTLTLKANSGILNLQPNYSHTTTYNPTSGIDVPEKIEYSIHLGKDFDIIGATNPTDDIKVTISATASNSTVVNSLVSAKYDFANKNILTIVLNNTTLGTDGKPIKLASVDVTFTLFNGAEPNVVQISSASSKIQFNWLALTNKTSVYTKEVLIPNNGTDIKLPINESNPETVNGGNYLTGIFDSAKALDITNPTDITLTDYNIKFYDTDGEIIEPVNVVRDGKTIQPPRLVMDDFGKITLEIVNDEGSYLRPTKIEFYVVALEKTTDVIRKQVWSVKKKVTINVNYVELTNFEKNLARNYIYSNETSTAAIIGLPETPFSITSSSGSNYSVSYSILNSKINGGGEFLASYLSLSESTIPYGDKNVKVLLLNIGKQIGVASNPEITEVTIKAVVSKNTTAVGELTSVVSLNRRDVDVNSEYKKKEVVYDINGENNSNIKTIELDKAMGDVLDENYKIKVTDTVGEVETEITGVYSYDIQVTNVSSNGSSLALDSVEFIVNSAGKLVCIVKSNISGSTQVLYKPTAINIILKIIENGIPVYAYSISVGIAWAS